LKKLNKIRFPVGKENLQVVKTNRFKIILPYLLSVFGVTFLTAGMFAIEGHINPITVALIFLLLVLFLATVFGSKPALFASALAMLSFNYFFLPPIGHFTISDSENWIALITFFIVAITAGQLSAKAKSRAEEAERLYRELQNAFEKASQAEALRQSEKLKSALLDAVTHDLRTPLTSIKASITMLIEEHEQNSIHLTLEREGRGELLEVIDEETDRLNDFIQSMVELARIEAGEFHLRKSQTDVEEIVSNALQRAKSLTSKHQLKVQIGDDLPPLSVDSKAIAEVVYNLLDNAAKYSTHNSKIEIEAVRVGDKIQFSVTDEGQGIAETEREKVFQKFYRADKTAKGFGMGLAIVRGIVEAHEGKIWIEESGKGSKFVFDLPVNFNGKKTKTSRR
jgi:two-component system sensor histidine kinase KdpD